MKKAVEPITAPNAIMGFTFRENQTIVARRSETNAKNHAPCRWKNGSDLSPKFLGSRKSQLKNRKTKKVPPPESKIGADFSTAILVASPFEKVKVREPSKPRLGLAK